MVQARILTIVLIVLVALGLLLEIIATATTGWYENAQSNGGLFRGCTKILNRCYDYADTPAYIEATGAFCILGILVAVVLLILVILRMVMDSMNSNNIVKLLVLVLSWVAFVFYFLAIVIYGGKVKNNLGYSYALACVATILQLVAAILATLMHLRVGPGA